MIERPDWVRRPNGRELAAAYPPPNKINAKGGSAMIQCAVNIQGLLEKCKVVSETPEGSGFGDSAILLAPSFQMRPKMVDGKPSGGAEVKIPINFIGMPSFGADLVRVLSSPPWKSTPTPEQVAAVYPSGSAAEALDRGHVLMRCRVLGDGHLTECQFVDPGAKAKGFAVAAQKLTPLFVVSLDESSGKLPRSLYVNLPIDLPNPKKPQQPAQILQPNWMAAPEPEAVKAAFPEKARQAKITSGRAVLDCKADHAGFLVDCSVAEETPAGLGFGAAAMTIVGKMRMNPWTVAGSPSDGALLHLPLRITDDLAPSEGAEAKPAAAKP